MNTIGVSGDILLTAHIYKIFEKKIATFHFFKKKRTWIEISITNQIMSTKEHFVLNPLRVNEKKFKKHCC